FSISFCGVEVRGRGVEPGVRRIQANGRGLTFLVFWSSLLAHIGGGGVGLCRFFERFCCFWINFRRPAFTIELLSVLLEIKKDFTGRFIPISRIFERRFCRFVFEVFVVLHCFFVRFTGGIFELLGRLIVFLCCLFGLARVFGFLRSTQSV